MAGIQTNPESLRSNQALRGRATQEVGRLQETREAGQNPVGQTGRADATQLSEELLEEVGKSGKVDGLQEDEAIAAIQKLFESKAADRSGADNAKTDDSKAVNGVKKGGGVKKTATWTPNTEAGQIVEGHGNIGRIEVKEEKTQAVDKPEKSQGAKGAQQAPKAVPQAQNASKQNSSTGKDDEQGQNETDKVELNPEAQQMLQKMSQNGLNTGGAQQAGSQAAEGSGKTESFEINTRASGMSQTVKVMPKGEVQDGQAIRTFQKLDDMPLDDQPNVKRTKGSDVADSQDKKTNETKPVEAAGAAAGLDAAQKERLRNPIENQ